MRLGLIAGTVFYGSDLFSDADERRIETPFGPALVLVTDRVAYVPRHGLDPNDYVLPHAVNHQANLLALKSLGVEEVVGVNSSGSLKSSLTPGSIVVPHDFVSLAAVPTIARNESLHVTPTLSERLRRKLLAAAEAAGVEVLDGGVYWQSLGPRLETKAEIAFIRHFADVVGMTLASEATVAVEAEMEYASLCSVDNFGHGLVAEPLTEEEIRTGAAANSRKMMAVFQKLVETTFGG